MASFHDKQSCPDNHGLWPWKAFQSLEIYFFGLSLVTRRLAGFMGENFYPAGFMNPFLHCYDIIRKKLISEQQQKKKLYWKFFNENVY